MSVRLSLTSDFELSDLTPGSRRFIFKWPPMPPRRHSRRAVLVLNVSAAVVFSLL